MDFFEFRQQLDELSKSTMQSYLKKADKSNIDHMHAGQKARQNARSASGTNSTLGSGHNPDAERKKSDHHSFKSSRRKDGMKRASGKLGVHNPAYKPGHDPAMKKEDAQLDELSGGTYQSYVKKSYHDAAKRDNPNATKKTKHKVDNRWKGINRAQDKLFKKGLEADPQRIPGPVGKGKVPKNKPLPAGNNPHA